MESSKGLFFVAHLKRLKQLGGLYKASPLKTSYKNGAYRAPVSRVKKSRETYLCSAIYRDYKPHL